MSFYYIYNLIVLSLKGDSASVTTWMTFYKMK
jgi:hypothetical protein